MRRGVEIHIAFTRILFVTYIVFTYSLHMLSYYICYILLIRYLVAYLSTSALLHTYTLHMLKIKTYYCIAHLSTLMLCY